MPSRVISRAAASSAPGAGNLGLVHVRITRVTASRPVSYGMSCSASNHADTWPGRSVSGLLSMASHKRLNSCAACSRVTAYTSLVLLVPLGSAFEDDGHRVVVRRPRVRSSPGTQVFSGAYAVVVHLSQHATQVGVWATTDPPLGSRLSRAVDGRHDDLGIHATVVPIAKVGAYPRPQHAAAPAVVTSYCGHVRRWLRSDNRQHNRLTDRRTDGNTIRLARTRACLVCRFSFLVSRFSFLVSRATCVCRMTVT